MKHRWGNVIQDREKQPEVEVSFNKGDEAAMSVISRWFGVTLREFKQMVKEKEDGKTEGSNLLRR
jgi:hypothetical protein